MRLATITNWAYGATVGLTLASGMTMLMASSAQQHERSAVAQRYQLDKATSELADDVYALTNHVRDYVITGDPTYVRIYERDAKALGSVENRIRHLGDAGAGADELSALKEAWRWADSLHDEQRQAVDARGKGNSERARDIMFGPEYERELDRVRAMVERFQYRLDQRTESDVAAATNVAKIWRTTSEAVLILTGLLFLCVLYFVFKQRVLRPVIRLSDVVSRLAAQDYAAEPPEYDSIDEIGDMAQAIRIFRENGLARQQLEDAQNTDRTMRDLLSRMTQRMQGAETIPELAEVLKRFVPEITPGRAGALYLHDKSRGVMVEVCAWLSPGHSHKEFSPIACWALRRGICHRPAGKTIDVPCDHLGVGANNGLDSICLPLIAQRETIGLLYFEPVSTSPSKEEDISELYLQMLAENISLALANLQLRDVLREMAMADPLTGLANRRQFDTMLALRLAEAERACQPLSCLMLDVDHFKRFNDDYGHDAGDAVLREVAATLASLVRETGLAFRYGGEEFVMLLPNFAAEQATERAEEIRARIASLRILHNGHALGSITASIGVATVPDHCASDRLVRTADAALFRAKESGRNQVMIASIRSADHQAA